MSAHLFFLLVALLFSIGLVGVISRRNLFVVYMSVELMLSAITLLFATLSQTLNSANASVMSLLTIAIIAAEAALFLAMIIHLYRINRTLDSEQCTSLKQEAS